MSPDELLYGLLDRVTKKRVISNVTSKVAWEYALAENDAKLGDSSVEESQRARRHRQKAMTALDIQGYTTLDVGMNRDGQFTVLEGNANPGLWSESKL